MQLNLLIAVILLLSIHLTKGQLYYNAFGGLGSLGGVSDWFGSPTFTRPMKTPGPYCIPCIRWSNFNMEMLSNADAFNHANKNADGQYPIHDDEPPPNRETKEKTKKNRLAEDSQPDFDKSGNEDIQPRDTARGGRDKATSWTTNSSDTEQPNLSFRTRANDEQQATTEGYVTELKFNRTFDKGPLIQVYVIAAGSGTAQTSIGHGGYHGFNNGYGVGKDSTPHSKGRGIDQATTKPYDSREIKSDSPEFSSRDKSFGMEEDVSDSTRDTSKITNSNSGRRSNSKRKEFNSHPEKIASQSMREILVDPFRGSSNRKFRRFLLRSK